MKYQIIFSLLALLFLVSCAKNENVTKGGFKYKIINEGKGKVASVGDYVAFHVSMLADGVEQFNSRNMGQESMVQIKEDDSSNIINKAMFECLATVKIGDSLELYIPTDSLKSLGFPETDTTKMLSYMIRITDIMNEAAFNEKSDIEREKAEAEAAVVTARLPEIEAFVAETYKYIASGKGGSNIVTDPSGIQYIMHEEGKGEQLKIGDMITVHYYGVLKSDGTMFDNSWRNGTPLQFPLGAGQVIRGWDEGFALLRKGAKATLIIPYEMAYGEGGRPPVIPAKSDLIFYVEVPE